MDLDKATEEMIESQIESAESQYDEVPVRPNVNSGRRDMKGNLSMAVAMGLMGQGMMSAPSTPKKPNASNGRPKDAATKKRRAKKKAGDKSRKKNRK